MSIDFNSLQLAHRRAFVAFNLLILKDMFYDNTTQETNNKCRLFLHDFWFGLIMKIASGKAFEFKERPEKKKDHFESLFS